MENAFIVIERNKGRILAVISVIALVILTYMLLSIPYEAGMVQGRIIRIGENEIDVVVKRIVWLDTSESLLSPLTISNGLCFGEKYNGELCSIGANVEVTFFKNFMQNSFWFVTGVIEEIPEG